MQFNSIIHFPIYIYNIANCDDWTCSQGDNISSIYLIMSVASCWIKHFFISIIYSDPDESEGIEVRLYRRQDATCHIG